MNSHWLFAYIVNDFLFTCGASLEVVYEFERGATHFGSLRAKLNEPQ